MDTKVGQILERIAVTSLERCVAKLSRISAGKWSVADAEVSCRTMEEAIRDHAGTRGAGAAVYFEVRGEFPFTSMVVFRPDDIEIISRGFLGFSFSKLPGLNQAQELLLSELRLPGIKLIWAALAETADKEGWPAARFLAALAEQEMVERSRRRFERHLEEARLPPGKTLDAFDFDAVPMVSKAQVQALAAGDAWLEKGANLLCFGPPGGGKSHLAAALGMALIEKGWRVLFTRTTDLVQKLQIARRDLALEAAIAKLDKYHLLILDDLAYVTKDQAETSVLFELISARYERRSMLITANQPFGEWGKIFPDQAMTLAAIDRLVHHATILEMNVDSYRRKEAVDKARGVGRPPTRATIKGSS